MRRPLLAGNWKMNTTLTEGVELVEALIEQLGDLSDREVVVCPPFTALGALAPLLDGSPIQLGGQNMFYALSGAYTGEISPTMLREIGCVYVILGHSERRQYFGEDDALINRKALAALEHGLRPIVCVGEVKAERDSGRAEEVVVQQLRGSLLNIKPELSDAATAQTVRIQYGGSVKPDNVDELMAQPDIDGALVGGASLKASDFVRIVRFQ